MILSKKVIPKLFLQRLITLVYKCTNVQQVCKCTNTEKMQGFKSNSEKINEEKWEEYFFDKRRNKFESLLFEGSKCVIAKKIRLQE